MGFSLRSLRQRLTALLTASLFSFAGFSANAAAQTSTFIDNVLAISYVEVGAAAYTLEFGLSVSGDNYDFGLLAAAETPLTSPEGAPTFDGSVLRVPSVEVDGTDFSLNLVLLTDSPVTFRLQSFAEVVDPGPTSLQQATTLFNASIETQIVQRRCVTCHIAGGVANGSGMHFLRSSATSAGTNLDVFSNYIDRMTSKRDRMLSMVQGIGHTGGQQLSSSSDDFAKLSEFLQLLLDHAAEQ